MQERYANIDIGYELLVEKRTRDVIQYIKTIRTILHNPFQQIDITNVMTLNQNYDIMKYNSRLMYTKVISEILINISKKIIPLQRTI